MIVMSKDTSSRHFYKFCFRPKSFLHYIVHIEKWYLYNHYKIMFYSFFSHTFIAFLLFFHFLSLLILSNKKKINYLKNCNKIVIQISLVLCLINSNLYPLLFCSTSVRWWLPTKCFLVIHVTFIVRILF